MSATGAGGGGGRRQDPLGKRALFSSPPDPADPSAPTSPPPGPPPAAGAGAGAGGQVRPARRQLFSGAGIGPRSVLVECRHCGSRTPVGAARLVRQLVPSLWRPASRYSRYMRCPACGRFGWCRLDWSVFRAL